MDAAVGAAVASGFLDIRSAARVALLAAPALQATVGQVLSKTTSRAVLKRDQSHRSNQSRDQISFCEARNEDSISYKSLQKFPQMFAAFL